jgi:predicted HTH domain antitoxin
MNGVIRVNVAHLFRGEASAHRGLASHAKLENMEGTRRALEALALEGYREQTLTLLQISEMLGLSRVETEDFLGQHHVPLAVIEEADLDREAAVFEAASRRNPR